jgi:hypothetical protein
LVERVLGKDEVSGSNPDTSSTLGIADCGLKNGRVGDQPVVHKLKR